MTSLIDTTTIAIVRAIEASGWHRRRKREDIFLRRSHSDDSFAWLSVSVAAREALAEIVVNVGVYAPAIAKTASFLAGTGTGGESPAVITSLASFEPERSAAYYVHDDLADLERTSARIGETVRAEALPWALARSALRDIHDELTAPNAHVASKEMQWLYLPTVLLLLGEDVESGLHVLQAGVSAHIERHGSGPYSDFYLAFADRVTLAAAGNVDLSNARRAIDRDIHALRRLTASSE
jgi:hypothetical protein